MFSDLCPDPGGLYQLTYTPREGDGDVVSAAPSLDVTVFDARHGVVSDSVNGSVLVGDYHNLTIDTTRPHVTFQSDVSWNNTVRPSNYEVLTAACGIVSDESHHGCSIYYSIAGTVLVWLHGLYSPNCTAVTRICLRT